MERETAEVTRDGRRIVLHRVGSGPTLLCLPGGPGFPGAHLGDLGGLSATHTVVTVDWRGSGESDAPEDGRHGVRDYVEDLAAIHSDLQRGPLILFGHSFGGIVAATYAAYFPDRVATLILDGTPDRLSDGRVPLNGIRSYFASWNEETQRYAEHTMASLYEPAAEWFGIHEYASVDLRDALTAITARTLIVSGDQDWAVGTAKAAQMADAIPGSEVAVIENAGHFAWIEQPVRYAKQISAFLDRA